MTRMSIGDKYQKVGTPYALRPGANLVIYVRRDLAGLYSSNKNIAEARLVDRVGQAALRGRYNSFTG